MRRNFAPLQNLLPGSSLVRRVLFALLLQLAAFTAMFGPVQAAETQRRVALVIGNSRYDHVESLANPVNDSKAMRETLGKLGFDVYSGDNLSLAEFNTLVNTFKSAALGADSALVYYSGHGFQLNGRNYLVPRDAVLADEAAIASETVRLDSLIGELQEPGRQTLFFLDACRNNPLPESRRSNQSVNKGLAPIEANEDVFVAFATQPNNISYDGQWELSPFTSAMTKFISAPGRGIEDVMRDVRNEVLLRTLRQQTPWEQSSLTKPFYFNGAPANAASQAVASLDLGTSPGGDLATAQRSTNIGDAIEDTLNEGVNNNIIMMPGVPGSASGNVILLDEAPMDVFGREDLVYAAQEQLRRVECYVGELDGLWSEASKEALKRYMVTKKFDVEGAQALELTQWHVDTLLREKGKVCKLPKPAVQATKTPRGSSRPAAARNTAGPRRNAPGPAAAAPSSNTKQITNSRVLGSFR